MESNSLIFTTSHPGAFGSTEDYNEEFVKRWNNYPKAIVGVESKTGLATLYIHGELERKVGFDIPIWLAGNLDVRKEVQDCEVYDVSGKTKYAAKIVMRDRENNILGRWYGLIVLPEEVEKTKITIGATSLGTLS